MGYETVVSFSFEVVGGITSINMTMVDYCKVYDGGGGFVVNDHFTFNFNIRIIQKISMTAKSGLILGP